MLRKIFASVLVVMALAFAPCCSDSVSEASPVYMGTYSDDGEAAYLLTDTVRIYNLYPLNFSCSVLSAGVYYNYHFFSKNGSPYYRNSGGYEADVFGGQSPIAANIYRFVRDNY